MLVPAPHYYFPGGRRFILLAALRTNLLLGIFTTAGDTAFDTARAIAVERFVGGETMSSLRSKPLTRFWSFGETCNDLLLFFYDFLGIALFVTYKESKLVFFGPEAIVGNLNPAALGVSQQENYCIFQRP